MSFEKVRELLANANPEPWAASQEADAPHGVCIYTAEGELKGGIVVYDTDYLTLGNARAAAIARNVLGPLVEALEGLVEAVGVAEEHEDVSQWTIYQSSKKVLADLQEQLQEANHPPG